MRVTPEFTMTFTTDPRGFRGPLSAGSAGKESWVLLFVGDSFTEGYGVNDGEEFPRLVGERLRAELGAKRPEVVNAGVGDTGTGRAIRFLRQWSEQDTRPTVLVFQFSPNDFEDNLREGLFDLDSRGLLRERSSEAPISIMRRLQPALESIPGLFHSYLFAVLVQALQAVSAEGSRGQDYSDTGGTDDLTYQLSEELMRLAEKKSWRVVVLFFGLDESRLNTLARISKQYGAKTVLIPDRTARPDLYYRNDDHWNSRGHTLVAEMLVPIIRDEFRRLSR